MSKTSASSSELSIESIAFLRHEQILATLPEKKEGYDATVSASPGSQVTITVQRAGQSSLRVTSQGVSKELVIQAEYQGNAIYVEIAQ